jgi:four helix bundle protein
MTPPELRKRTAVFARAIVALTNPLLPRLKTQDVARQLRRAALSTASNYRAACRAKSHKDFTSKIGTVLEEIDEAQGWLETLRDCGLADARALAPHLNEAEELVKIFTASHRTSRGNNPPRDRRKPPSNEPPSDRR